MVTTLKYKLRTAHCNSCGRITGRDDKGNCLACLQIQEREYKASQQTENKIGMAASLHAQGYEPHFQAIECEAVMGTRCKLCAGACYYIGLKKGSSYKAISRCVKCGNEIEI